MVTYNGVTCHTLTGKPIHTITLTGVAAHDIEMANRANFYGIWGNGAYCAAGLRAAHDAVNEYLEQTKTFCYASMILGTRTIDTTGTKTPYKAEIDFLLDV